VVVGLVLAGLVLVLCVTSSKLLYRFGVPALLIFLVLGMLFGSDGIVGIQFDDFTFSRDICSIALIFIMFYGGFGTNWMMAKPVIGRSILMSSLGVVLTAGITGLFCYFVLGVPLLESLLIGSVISSTDAASVFAILRSRKLNLKGGLASLLEVESGSNDPFSYMLTIVVLTYMSASEDVNIPLMLIIQVAVGLLIGYAVARLSILLLKQVNFEVDGLYPILVIAVAILSYGLSETLGGNGYLSVYLAGIMMGNSKIPHKKSLVRFFDGISWLMQIILFFILGLLSFPSRLPQVFFLGLAIALFLLVARLVVTFLLLSWFKTPVKSQLFVAWSGLRGAASIVFAIYALTYGVDIENDIFHIVFLVALFSVAVQGTLLPYLAKKLDLVTTDTPVLKTFNDYQEEAATKLLEFRVEADHPWAEKSIMDADIPEEILVVMLKRGNEVIVPKGLTRIHTGDIIVLSSNDFDRIPH
jgi:cell volume regulation protein A